MGEGLRGVPLAVAPLNRKDFTPGAEVRWCPGCGDYSVLATFQGLLPDLGVKRENVVIVSGIGCSSRFPYYVNTYGLHSIHGRAAAIATGVALAREDLAVWVVTGDGDALSIGGNHLIHALRRNVNITIMLFNNRIYGLTKGQASPTSERGKITKSTPAGLVDDPFNPVALALGAGATFVARTMDSARAHLAETLKAAVNHRGASLVEIYQNCQIFNDGAFDSLKAADAEVIPLVHGEKIVFGPDSSLGVVRAADGSLAVAPVAEAGLDAVLTHDAHRDDPSLGFELSQLTDMGIVRRAPIGIFRDVSHPVHDDEARSQVTTVADPVQRLASLQKYITGKDTWTVTAG
ncbi:MAG: 2-oxoacid:ferredoxin oxidoreductase subunit beta [Propionibacteriaceae bacterium]|jgi:2-oxoglutarate ferredoxin oxidoreductase subunit beta|nr:2-oxoacid:ferredoxin oxidoreductase subunit beta [Propionibacteriaceae bacterium]